MTPRPSAPRGTWCDSRASSPGDLSKIFNDEWMRENGFLEGEEGLGTIRDLLTLKGGEGVITAKASHRVRDVVSRMKAHGISQLPVTRGDELLGAVAEVDLLRYLVSRESSLDGTVEPLVESDYATVSPLTQIEEVKAILSAARMAVVLEEERIVGIVTKIDLIDYLARRATSSTPASKSSLGESRLRMSHASSSGKS